MKKIVYICIVAIIAFGCETQTQTQTFDPFSFISDADIEVLHEPVLPEEGTIVTDQSALAEANMILVGKYISYENYSEIGAEDEWGLFTVPCSEVTDLNETPIKPAINHYFGQITQVKEGHKEIIISRGYTIKGVQKIQFESERYTGYAWKLLVKPGKTCLDLTEIIEDMTQFMYASE